MSFRFPDGVEFLGEHDGNARFKVSIPTDDDGFFGRECPACNQHFRIAHEDYDDLPDDVELWCVYCGHHDDHSEFLTEQQRNRVMRAANDYARQRIGQALQESFGRSARRTRGSFVAITYRSKPFYPSPLPGIDELRLVRERSCEACGLRYAVFGEHRFCPVCGLLPSLVSALDALTAETVRLDALCDLSGGWRARLEETGVLDRTYADAIENVVGAVETMAERTFRELVPNADAVLRGRGKVFQRLDDCADIFQNEGGVNLRAALGSSWDRMHATWAARHVFTHRDGIVDDRYMRAVPTTGLRVGQRLRATEQLARAAIRDAHDLCRALAGEL
jgi:hypothetical protein